MTYLTVMRGISGSGKSTTAREIQKNNPGAVVVSRDDLRLAFFNIPFGPEVDEDYITEVEHFAIRAALASGHSVIADSTHIQQRFINKLAQIADEFDAEFSVLETGVGLETSLDRNRARGESGGRFVPEYVIEKQFKSMKKAKIPDPVRFTPYVPDPDLPKTVLVDLDGTLAITGDRGIFDWAKVGVDDPRVPLRDLLRSLKNDVTVIYLSGRDEVCRNETLNWLTNVAQVQTVGGLFMRPNKDNRPDTYVKAELFDNHIRDRYNVIGVFDDRPSVCRMWLKAGLPIYHVTPFVKDF